MIKRRRTDTSAEMPDNEREGASLAEADPAAIADPPQDSTGTGAAEPQASANTEAPADAPSRRRGRKRKRDNKAGASADTNPRGDSGSGGSDGGGASAANGSTPPPRKGGRVIATLALLLALAAGGAAGYLGWRLLQLEERVAQIPDQRQAALEPLASAEALETMEQELAQRTESLGRRIEEQSSSLEQRLTRAEEERSDAIGRLRQRVETAETAVQSMRDQRERDGADWRMAEVRFLVSMAVRQLQITGNVAGAIAALEAADHALGQMGDPRVLDLRERIVDDIATLREVEPADVEGIALRVQNLAPRIPDLVRATANSEADGVTEAPAQRGDEAAASSNDAGWWGALRERIGELVTVRREPEADPPSPRDAQTETPAPSAELPAAERLVVALREASRAALNHEPGPYRAAIERARRIVADAYDPEAPVNQRFREDLAALHERRVTTELPDLTPTLERAQSLAARLQDGAGATEGDR